MGGRVDGWGPGACPGGITMLLGLLDVLVSWLQLDEDKHKAPASALHHTLSLRRLTIKGCDQLRPYRQGEIDD